MPTTSAQALLLLSLLMAGAAFAGRRQLNARARRRR
ncbi:MAG: IPTL-CTERM sorting domain-containing protein [Pseudomonadota bacterium]|nr:IPTL-CTERM sorting domain-containing protein [Pseudomonadota bacterium]